MTKESLAAPLGWLDMPHGVLRFGDLPHLLANAMHPDPASGAKLASDYAAARIAFDRELPLAVSAGQLTARLQSSLGSHPVPVGQTLLDSAVLVTDLHEYMMATRRIGVRVAEFDARAAMPQPTAVATLPSVRWHELARALARKFIAQQATRDLYPSQVEVADAVAAEFRKRTPPIVGTDGKPLAGSTIKRHALSGISSAVKRAASTTIKRGK